MFKQEVKDDFSRERILYRFPVVIFFILVSSRTNMAVKLPVEYSLKVVNQNSAINPTRMRNFAIFLWPQAS